MHDKPPCTEHIPCPGLTGEKHKLISQYLSRTGALGGGARSVTKIALEKYSKLYHRLRSKEQRLVRATQKKERAWLNDHDFQQDIQECHTCSAEG